MTPSTALTRAPARPSAPPPVPPSRRKAEDVKHALLAETDSTRKRKSIEAVWAALTSMSDRGETVFRVPRVAAAIARLGFSGPKEQSIRNREGEAYRTLIAAYAEEHGTVRKPSGHEDDDLALAIGDAKVAARVRAVLAQNRALQLRNDLLHQQYTRLAERPPLPRPASGDGTTSGGQPFAEPFTREEVRAVASFLRSLEHQGWRVDGDTGAILDHRESEIAPPYFADALRRVAASA